MNAGKLHRRLELLLPFTASQIDAKSRVLRSSGLLESRGRGQHAGDVHASDARNLIIGLAAPKIDQAAEFTIHCNRLTAAGDDEWGFAGCRTFGEAFEAILEDDTDKYGTASVTIIIDWPQATIQLEDGRSFQYGTPEAARRDGYETFGGHTNLEIGGGVLRQFALYLKDDGQPRGGWVGELESKIGEQGDTTDPAPTHRTSAAEDK